MKIGDYVSRVGFDSSQVGYIIDIAKDFGRNPKFKVRWRGIDKKVTWHTRDELAQTPIIENGKLECNFFTDHSSEKKYERVEQFRDDVRNVLSQYRKTNQVGGSHYTDMVVEPIDLYYLNNLTPLQLKVVKYVMRYQTKDGLKDIKKAREMLGKIAAYEYNVDLEEENED